MKKWFFPICKWILIFLWVILWGILSIIIFGAYHYSVGYKSIDEYTKNTIHNVVNNTWIIVNDIWEKRRTGNTFLSIPEWYIVSISDDYTLWLERGNNPSDFPFMTYLSDMWNLYGKITATMDGTFPRDYEYHTMVRVIALSTTLEFWTKALYENTIGRITSIFSYKSDEDIFYENFSRDYVRFILLRPWYEYPFDSKLWEFQLSRYTLRSIERYIVVSLELCIKNIYAKIIEDAAHASFAIPDIWTHVSGVFSTGTIINIPNESLRSVTGGILLPRYYPFTEYFPILLNSWIGNITHIAGNTHFMSEFISQKPDNTALFEFRIPIENEVYRQFYFTDVGGFRTLMSQNTIKLQHIYDF